MRSGDDIVRASSVERAEEAARLLEQGRELIEARVPDVRDGGVEVWLQPELRLGFWMGLLSPELEFKGITVTVPSLARPRIYLREDDYQEGLVHEMVHALLGESWDTLPQAVEEGLCERIEELVIESPYTGLWLALASGRSELSLRFEYRTPEGGVAYSMGQMSFLEESDGEVDPDVPIVQLLEQEGYADLSTAQAGRLYGVGYFIAGRIVARHGIDGLNELCVRAAEAGEATVPSRWLLDAAGIIDGPQLQMLLDEELEARLPALLFASAGFAAFVDRMRARGCDECSVGELVERFEPKVRFEHWRTVPLEELGGFDDWASAHWAKVVTVEAP